jgi:hypothetical protein
MAFLIQDFHDLLDQDIFAIQQMLELPEDPAPTTTTLADGTIQLNLIDSIGLSYEIEAVKSYRQKILPLIFVITQKVYSELFRLVLGHSGITSGWRQFDVETDLTNALASNTITNRSPFLDQSEFNQYWSSKYNFATLRKARNQVIHKAYSFNLGILAVTDEHNIHLLSYTESDILDFANEVLGISNRV